MLILQAFAMMKEDPGLPAEVALRLAAAGAQIRPVDALELLRYAAAGYAVEQT
jgi:hypothetical protein